MRSSPSREGRRCHIGPEHGPNPQEQDVRPLGIGRIGLVVATLVGVGLGALRAAPGPELQRGPGEHAGALGCPAAFPQKTGRAL